MTDFAAEQEMEMEALQAILMDDLQPYSGTLPDDWPAVGQTYMVAITPSEDSEAKPVEFPMEMEMMFAHTARYPEEPPCVRLLSVRGLSDAAVAEATSMVREQIEQNLGMAMIFTLVSAAKEWLRGKIVDVSQPEVNAAKERAAREAAEEARRAALRAAGTPVTRESFMAWKAKYDAEMALARAALAAKEADGGGGARLTGKAYFRSLAAGEKEEGGDVEEDEEEFEDEEADGDYVPGRDDDDDDEDFDYDEDDSDDEGMLDEYLARKK